MHHASTPKRLAEIEECQHKREWAQINLRHSISGVCLFVSLVLGGMSLRAGSTQASIFPIAFLVGVVSLFVFLQAHADMAAERTRHEAEMQRLERNYEKDVE